MCIRDSINTWWRPDSYYQQSEWRATWGGEGGGVLVNQAPHQLDLWQWICGIPTKVTSKNINGSHRKIDVENDVTIVTEYANGATGSFITCTHDAIGTDRLEIDLDGGKIVVEDSKKAKIYRMKKTEPETVSYTHLALLSGAKHSRTCAHALSAARYETHSVYNILCLFTILTTDFQAFCC